MKAALVVSILLLASALVVAAASAQDTPPFPSTGGSAHPFGPAPEAGASTARSTLTLARLISNYPSLALAMGTWLTLPGLEIQAPQPVPAVTRREGSRRAFARVRG